ncbi:MAG: preprotein translocase subunit SecE [Planctomycetaceae bacterium]|nr:preprotein translocase subunit SecE [Planctomycetaceae bacterium]
MAKSSLMKDLLAGMLSVGLYKRNQGQQVRQVSGVTTAVVFIIAATTLSDNFPVGTSQAIVSGLPVLIGVLGCWFAYRIVNVAPIADFMIGVQGEMDKVSWPSWPQLWRATVVVLVTMLFLALSLFLFDLIWQFVFQSVGFLKM